jgi:hypothetical protein
VTDTAAVVRALSSCFREDPFHHGRLGVGATECDGFHKRMLAAFEEAARDPVGFAARHRPQHPSAEQSAPAREAGQPDYGWGQAFAKASGQAPSGAT